jgi:hypothetical protein
MWDQGKVSCLMATYGRYTKVCEALTCFLKQTYDNRELIILNTHPDPLRSKHPKVQILNERRYRSLGQCRERLLDFASGEFCRTWDDDDLYLPWAIEEGVKQLAERPEVAAWKPARSWFMTPATIELAGNAMEASITCRTKVARRWGYRHGQGDEHAQLLHGISAAGGLAQTETKHWASYVYRWGFGLHHASGSLGSGKSLEARIGDWKTANQDSGIDEGGVLKEVCIDKYWQRISHYLYAFPDYDAWCYTIGIPFVSSSDPPEEGARPWEVRA